MPAFSRSTPRPSPPLAERVARAGLWLGLLAFVGLLWLPAPRGMHVAARQHFAGRLPEDVARVLAHAGDPAAKPGSSAYLAAESRVVAAYAERMMAAAAVCALVAVWWMTVALPIPVTSLLPLALFPLVGVLSIDQAAAPYANPNVFLFLGGFVIALGLERWELHRRIALRVVAWVGTGRARLVMGFMLASAVLSLWISNTATAMLMLPIGMAVIASLERGDGPTDANFAGALMLGIAYGASIGGIGTPIGTPPNLVLRGQWATLFPQRGELGFGAWMAAFVPMVGVLLVLTWLVLVRGTFRLRGSGAAGSQAPVRAELARLGPLRRPQVLMLLVFGLTGALWITRTIPLGDGREVGWAPWLERALRPAEPVAPPFRAADVQDATVALLMAALLFILPGDRAADGRRGALMDWTTAARLPWGVLLLFGGGFSIAVAFERSGLSRWCGQAFTALPTHDPTLLTAGICFVVTFLTELTSNTATAQIVLPIAAQAGVAAGVEPLALMLAATISASCAFMLPVATPPNAIVFATGQVPMGRMVLTGLVLNLIGVVVVTLTIRLLALPLLL